MREYQVIGGEPFVPPLDGPTATSEEVAIWMQSQLLVAMGEIEQRLQEINSTIAERLVGICDELSNRS